MANVIEVNEANFQEEVVEATQPVLVDFWASWCGYCSKLVPIIDEMAAEYSGKLKIVKVNVDENRTIAQTYGIKSLPTMLLFKEGEPAEKMLGYMPKVNIMSKISPFL